MMAMGMAARFHTAPPARPQPCHPLTAAYLRSAHAQSISTATERLGIIAIILQSLGSQSMRVPSRLPKPKKPVEC